jgi:Mg2+ and Co2+ transporter CorA
MSSLRPNAITIIDSNGVGGNASIEDVRTRISTGRLFWLDICGAEASLASQFLCQMGLAEADRAQTLRFGQTGRISIGRHGIRAVTWLADPPKDSQIEVHFLSCPKFIFTIWNGEPRILDEARQEFADRVAGVETGSYHAAAIVLQLLLATQDNEIRRADEVTHAVRQQLKENPKSVSFDELSSQLDLLRSVWLKLDRYSAAVRSAVVGLEAITGIAEQGVAELDDYRENVEDVTNRLSERFHLASDLVRDYSTALAERQGQQINRLTVVSIIFLPITFLTGFFGMNFGWMASHLANTTSFITLGILLPVVCAVTTILWLRRRGLL